MTDAIDHGCSGAITATDHGCDGTVTPQTCSQAESVSLSGLIFLAGIARKSSTTSTSATIDGQITLTPTISVTEGEQVPSLNGSITLSPSMSIQVTGTGVTPGHRQEAFPEQQPR